MCGIAGVIDYTFKTSKQQVARMVQCLDHRGPDDQGVFFDSNDSFSIGLGHKRLSIIDISDSGHQPMKFRHWTVIFNGEIYNYAEIKEELLRLGDHFESGSDTEVLLKAFDRWGHSAVDKFIGMFAFALFNENSRELYLYRDRAGVKPLYYYWDNDLLVFGSEIKAINALIKDRLSIDKTALALYFRYGFIPAPYSIFKKCFKVNPGHYIKVKLDTKQLQEIVYWNVLDFYNLPKKTLPESLILEQLEPLLRSACEYRMVADVPVGIFLSGGYDSSLVAALLQGVTNRTLDTFTIGFSEKGYDEAGFAKDIANYLGTHHRQQYCTSEDALKIIESLPYFFDEPFGDSSAIPTILLSQFARKHVTVALSADGGDEIFGGYDRYLSGQSITAKLNRIPYPARRIAAYALENLGSYNGDFAIKHQQLGGILSQENTADYYLKLSTSRLSASVEKKLLIEKIDQRKTNYDAAKLLNGHNDNLDRLMAIDYKTYLVDDILTKVDRATMSVGLEGREPLLDHRLIEFAAQLPSEWKIRNGEQKYLLKTLAHKFIPEQFLKRPKQGFGVPLVKWMKSDLTRLMDIYLDDSAIERQQILDIDMVRKLKRSYVNGNDKNFELLWFIIVFQMWYSTWVETKGLAHN